MKVWLFSATTQATVHRCSMKKLFWNVWKNSREIIFSRAISSFFYEYLFLQNISCGCFFFSTESVLTFQVINNIVLFEVTPRKRAVSAKIRAIGPKLYANCGFLQNFRSIKLDKYTVFYAVLKLMNHDISNAE